MQHIHRTSELDRVHRAVGVAVPLLDDFQHAGGSKTLQWLCLAELFSGLRQMQRVSENVLDSIGNFQQIRLAGGHPIKRLGAGWLCRHSISKEVYYSTWGLGWSFRHVLRSQVGVALQRGPRLVQVKCATSGMSKPVSNRREVASCRRSWKCRSLRPSRRTARVKAAPIDFELYGNTSVEDRSHRFSATRAIMLHKM